MLFYFQCKVEKFLKNYELYIDEGQIEIVFKHTVNYIELLEKEYEELSASEDSGKDIFGISRRFKLAFDHFTDALPKMYHNFKVITEEFQSISVF